MEPLWPLFQLEARAPKDWARECNSPSPVPRPVQVAYAAASVVVAAVVVPLGVAVAVSRLSVGRHSRTKEYSFASTRPPLELAAMADRKRPNWPPTCDGAARLHGRRRPARDRAADWSAHLHPVDPPAGSMGGAAADIVLANRPLERKQVASWSSRGEQEAAAQRGLSGRNYRALNSTYLAMKTCRSMASPKFASFLRSASSPASSLGQFELGSRSSSASLSVCLLVCSLPVGRWPPARSLARKPKPLLSASALLECEREFASAGEPKRSLSCARN